MRLAILAAANSIHTVRWVNALAARGHHVHLFTIHPEQDPINANVEVLHLPWRPPAGYFLSAPALGAALRKLQPDLFHAHYASGYGTLARLVRFHPFVLSVWGGDVFDFTDGSPLHRWIVRSNLRAADWVCSTSEMMARHTRRLCPHVTEVTVTPFGVDLERFRPLGTSEARKVITVGTVKTLHPKYGIDLLIEGFARVRERLGMDAPDLARKMRLLIVGGGPQQAELEQMAVGLGIQNVTEFVGQIPHAEIPLYLNRLDVYVAASRLASESFGVAVIEASACGVPVVVADIGGLPEVVNDGVTGFVTVPENPDALAKQIQLLVVDEPLRKRMGIAGVEWVRAHYDWEANVDVMEDVYKRATLNCRRLLG